MNYFTVEEDLKQLHIQIPKALLYEKKYNGLSNDAKILYGFFLDRVSLSLRNGWFDEQNRLYIKCDQISMAKILGCAEKKARKIRDELVSFELLDEVKKGQGKSNYLYPKKVQVTVSELDSYIESFAEEVNVIRKNERERISKYRKNNDKSIENTINGQNDRSETVVKDVQEQSFSVYSNTDFSNTDLKVDVDVTAKHENDVINLYKTFKLEKKVMPHTIRLLKQYTEFISLEVFEYIFIQAKEDSVAKKYNYIKTMLETFYDNKVFDMNELAKYNQKFKESKKDTKSKNTNKQDKQIKTRFHNITDRTQNYTPEELESLLKENQAAKYANKKAKEVEFKEDTHDVAEITVELVQTCIENVNYFNSLDINGKSAVRDYINNKGGFMPLHIKNFK